MMDEARSFRSSSIHMALFPRLRNSRVNAYCSHTRRKSSSSRLGISVVCDSQPNAAAIPPAPLRPPKACFIETGSFPPSLPVSKPITRGNKNPPSPPPHPPRSPSNDDDDDEASLAFHKDRDGALLLGAWRRSLPPLFTPDL